MIQIGDALPACTLMEYVEVPGDGCSIGPSPVALPAALQGKTIALFAVPGAFTPPAQKRICPVLWPRQKRLKPPVWMRFGVWP